MKKDSVAKKPRQPGGDETRLLWGSAKLISFLVLILQTSALWYVDAKNPNTTLQNSDSSKPEKKEHQDLDKSIEKGVNCLISLGSQHPKGTGHTRGRLGIEVCAMAQCGLGKDKLYEHVQKALKAFSDRGKITTLENGKLKTVDTGRFFGMDLVSAFIVLSLLETDPEKYKAEIEEHTKRVVKVYTEKHFRGIYIPYFDLYAFLSLYLISEHRKDLVPDQIWKDGENFFRGRQKEDGTWRYDYGKDDEPGARRPWVHGTNTCAGAVIIGLCMLKQDKKLRAKDLAKDPAISKTLAWLDKNFVADKNPGAIPQYNNSYQFLYAQGILATLVGREKFGEQDWYKEGAKHIVSTQNEKGYWEGGGHYDLTLDSSISVLFLKKHFFFKWVEGETK